MKRYMSAGSTRTLSLWLGGHKPSTEPRNCRLVILGGVDPRKYGERLRIRESKLGRLIKTRECAPSGHAMQKQLPCREAVSLFSGQARDTARLC